MIQRRKDGSVDFDLVWANYEAGFGSVTEEFWIGACIVILAKHVEDAFVTARTHIGRKKL